MTPENIALILSGLLLPFLVEIIKRMNGNLTDRRALWTFFGVSTLVALIASAVTGGFPAVPVFPVDDPSATLVVVLQFAGALLSRIAEVVALATLVYQNWKNNVKSVSAKIVPEK